MHRLATINNKLLLHPRPSIQLLGINNDIKNNFNRLLRYSISHNYEITNFAIPQH